MAFTGVDQSYVGEAFRNRLVGRDWSTAPKMMSLFSGCGGLDLSFHKAGYELVYANEMDEDAGRTFANNISDRVEVCPIENVDMDGLPDVDLITGGFPCQDFSIIWKRPGLEGTRGNLYTYFLEAVAKTKPKAFVAENVKGLLTVSGGKAIQRILEDFQSIEPGYVVFPKVYNFADHGVPQFRQRVLLVGVRADTGFNFVHPAGSFGPGKKYPFVTAGQALLDIDDSYPNMEHMRIMPRTRELLSRIPAGGNFTDIPVDDPYYVKGMISHVYRRIHPDKPSMTLIAGGGGGTWGYHFPENRALTNRERARLQSFPDDFVFTGSFGEIRRQIGNAVSPVGVIDLVNSLSPLFSGDYEPIDLGQVSMSMARFSLKDRMKLSTTNDAINWMEIETTERAKVAKPEPVQ